MTNKLLWCAIGVALDRFAYSAKAPEYDEKTVSILDDSTSQYIYKASIVVGGEAYSLSYNFLDNAFMTGYITISKGARRVTLSVTTRGDSILYVLNPSTHYEFHLFHETSILGIVMTSGTKRLIQSLTIKDDDGNYQVDIVNCTPKETKLTRHQLHALTIASNIRKRPVVLEDLILMESGSLTMFVCTRDDRNIIILDKLDQRKKNGTVEILNSEYRQTFYYTRNTPSTSYSVEDRIPDRAGSDIVQDSYDFRIKKDEIKMSDSERPYRFLLKKNTITFI